MDALCCRHKVICILESVHRHGLCMCMWYATRWNPQVLSGPGCGQQAAGDAWALRSRVLLLLMLWAQWSLPLLHTRTLSHRAAACTLTGSTEQPPGSWWAEAFCTRGSACLLGVTQQPGTEPCLGRSDCYRLWWCLLPDALLHPKQTNGASNLSAKPLFCTAFPQRT